MQSRLQRHPSLTQRYSYIVSLFSGWAGLTYTANRTAAGDPPTQRGHHLYCPKIPKIMLLFIQLQWALELRKVWCSNNLKLEQKIRENPVLKFEQKLESRTKNHMVVTWSPSLCLIARASSSVSSPVTGSVSISQIQSLFKRFIYLGYFYVIFNNIHSKWHQRKLLEVKSLRGKS
jgi:hypothetical protein